MHEKIIKYEDFNKLILEDKDTVFKEVPEEIIDTALNMLKSNIEDLFKTVEDDTNTSTLSLNDDEFSKKIKDKGKELSFEIMGLNLIYVKVNSYSRTNRSIDMRFSDTDNNMYSLYIRVDIDAGISTKDDIAIEPKMVKNAFIKFKKYDDNNNLVDSISRNVKDMWEIGDSEESLINLKLEVDGNTNEDELIIET